MKPEYKRALACAMHYRKLGLSPMPSRMQAKGPMLDSYASHYGDVPIPESVYADWRTTNLQIITGTQHAGPTKIVVVDLDGPEAKDAWAKIEMRNTPLDERTWIASTGGGGTHIYYRLPDGTKECPSGMLYGLWDTFGDDSRGKWAKHKEVRLLADRALVVAPPSIHVETGKPYQFWSASSPNDIRLPAMAPQWLLEMPRLVAPNCRPEPKPVAPLPPRAFSGWFYRREEVLNAIPDKVALARDWGLRTAAAKANDSGWVSCYAAGREDGRPSASISESTGSYQDRTGDMRIIPLFDLGALLQPGLFRDWRDCRDWCGDRFIGRAR